MKVKPSVNHKIKLIQMKLASKCFIESQMRANMSFLVSAM